jgi:hypothetical protein
LANWDSTATQANPEDLDHATGQLVDLLEKLAERFCFAWQILMQDLRRQLCSGELIAEGTLFRPLPDGPLKFEVPAAWWPNASLFARPSCAISGAERIDNLRIRWAGAGQVSPPSPTGGKQATASVLRLVDTAPGRDRPTHKPTIKGEVHDAARALLARGIIECRHGSHARLVDELLAIFPEASRNTLEKYSRAAHQDWKAGYKPDK